MVANDKYLDILKMNVNPTNSSIKLKKHKKLTAKVIEKKLVPSTEDGFINSQKFAIDTNKKSKRNVHYKFVSFDTLDGKLATPKSQQVLTTISTSNIRSSTNCKPKRLKKLSNKKETRNPVEIIVEKPNTSSQSLKSESKSKSIEVKKRTSTNNVTSSTEMARACMQYCRAAQQALTLLNNEVSSALRDSFCSLNDIQMRVRNTIEEINKSDILYEHLRNRHYPAPISYSSPYLTELLCPNDIGKDSALERALSVGLVQTQSENQMRLAVLPSIKEDTTNSTCSKSDMKQKTMEEDIKEINAIPIMPKLVTIVEDPDQPCTVLKQQKKLFNIPIQFYSDEDKEKTNQSNVKQKVEGGDVNDQDDLHRIRGQQNLHKKLIKEFEATDSLLEFQRKMKYSNPPQKTKSKHVPDNPQSFHIMAEELFVPEKVNKIMATNLNSSKQKPQKTSQFFYREKNKSKKKSLMTSSNNNMVKKYPDTCLFATEVSKCNTSRNREVPSTNELEDNSVNVEHKPSHKLIENVNKENARPVSYKTGLDCFDILDEITLKDVQPIVSEYPRKDHIGCNDIQVEDTYLYKLVYEPIQDEFSKLFEFEEPRLCVCHKCENGNSKKAQQKVKKVADDQQEKNDIIPLHKKSQSLKLPTKSEIKSNIKKPKKITKEEIEAKLKPYIFDPRMRYPTTITVMPVMVTTYTNPHFVEEKNQSGDARRNAVKQHTVKYEKKKGGESKNQKSLNSNMTSLLNKQNTEKLQQPSGDSWDESKVIKKPTKQTKVLKKPVSHTMLQKHAAESRKLLKDIQKLSQKTKLESSIQSVIDMIENKIVEILSSPEKTHSEAFATVETKILDILNSMQNNERALEPICEAVNNTDSRAFPKNLKKTASSNITITRSITTNSLLPIIKDVKVLHVDVPSKYFHKKAKKESVTVIEAGAFQSPDLGKSIEHLGKIASKSSINDNLTNDDTSSKLFDNEKCKNSFENILQTIGEPCLLPHKEKVSHFDTTSNASSILTKNVCRNQPNTVVKTKSEFEIIQLQQKFNEPFIKIKSVTKCNINAIEVVQNIIESSVKVDKFLTTVKNIKINQFLDSLIHISDDLPNKILAKQHSYVTYYKHKLKIPCILHQPKTFYPITIHFPIVIIQMQTFSNKSSINKQKQSKMLTPIEFVKPVIPQQLPGSEVICCRVDKVISGLHSYRRHTNTIPCRTLGTQSENATFESSEMDTTDHNTLLTSLYSLLFSTMFLGLTFNYSCN